MKPEYIVIHTAGPADKDGKPVLVYQDFETVRDYHVRKRGWVDIGYHGYIEEDGTFHEGRALNKAGAHVEGLNYKSLGICCAGHGDLADFTEAQKRKLVIVVAQWMKLFDIPIGKVLGHRECYSIPGVKNTGKSCPGKKVDLEELRRRILIVHDEEKRVVEIPEPRIELAIPVRELNERLNLEPSKMATQAGKPWWQSKTNIVGAVQLVAGLAECITTHNLIGGDAAGVVATIGGAAMIVLRFLTSQPVTAK